MENTTQKERLERLAWQRHLEMARNKEERTHYEVSAMWQPPLWPPVVCSAEDLNSPDDRHRLPTVFTAENPVASSAVDSSGVLGVLVKI